MAYRLGKRESVPDGIRRIAREAIDEASTRLQGGGTREARVHETRKLFKRIRALLRLVREPIGEPVFLRDDALVRALGRRLGPARDASVLVRTFALLKKGSGRRFPAGLAGFEKDIRARRDEAFVRLEKDRTFRRVADALSPLRLRVGGWPLPDGGFDTLERGLTRAFRKGRKLRVSALDSRRDDDLHEWRKRAKELRYDVELFEEARPGPLKAFEKTLGKLTDALGDDHDLAALADALREGSKGDPRAEVLALVEERRARLQKKARKAGADAYAAKPRKFRRRMKAAFGGRPARLV
jgi:CHAD domain-containing protein